MTRVDKRPLQEYHKVMLGRPKTAVKARPKFMVFSGSNWLPLISIAEQVSGVTDLAISGNTPTAELPRSRTPSARRVREDRRDGSMSPLTAGRRFLPPINTDGSPQSDSSEPPVFDLPRAETKTSNGQQHHTRRHVRKPLGSYEAPRSESLSSLKTSSIFLDSPEAKKVLNIELNELQNAKKCVCENPLVVALPSCRLCYQAVCHRPWCTLVTTKITLPVCQRCLLPIECPEQPKPKVKKLQANASPVGETNVEGNTQRVGNSWRNLLQKTSSLLTGQTLSSNQCLTPTQTSINQLHVNQKDIIHRYLSVDSGSSHPDHSNGVFVHHLSRRTPSADSSTSCDHSHMSEEEKEALLEKLTMLSDGSRLEISGLQCSKSSIGSRTPSRRSSAHPYADGDAWGLTDTSSYNASAPSDRLGSRGTSDSDYSQIGDEPDEMAVDIFTRQENGEHLSRPSTCSTITETRDWGEIHRQAYLMAVSTERARKLLKQAKLHGKASLEYVLDLNLSQSFVYSYYDKKPKTVNKQQQQQQQQRKISAKLPQHRRGRQDTGISSSSLTSVRGRKTPKI